MNANTYWMKYSIEISKGASPSALRVGIVIVSEYNELICSTFAGEEQKESWSSVILGKVRILKITSAQSIYITINTLSMTNTFELNDLLAEVHINELFVGLPAPNLKHYLQDDPTIICNHVYRYPDELLREIFILNYPFFVDSEQSIMHSPYYSEHRISNLVIKRLTSQGFIVSKEEINANKQKFALANLICCRYQITFSEATSIVYHAIAEAFNHKYGKYKYSNDTRSLDLDWKENFLSIYQRSSTRPLFTINILNVGVGSGHEAISLFSNCKYVTFVDIAKDGLEKIKEQIPLSKIVVASADDLSCIPDNSQDLYVSLRTYNSSFFDIKVAISEAYRVLKSNSLIIISVANGFLCPEQDYIIPGLIIPGTDFVDIYRGINIAKLIYSECLQVGFKNINLFPTNAEIYLSAFST